MNRIEGLLVTKDTKDKVEQFAHDRAADLKRFEVPGFQRVSPFGDRHAPAASNAGRHEEALRKKALPILLNRVLP